jgi:hypothetical protein
VLLLVEREGTAAVRAALAALVDELGESRESV